MPLLSSGADIFFFLLSARREKNIYVGGDGGNGSASAFSHIWNRNLKIGSKMQHIPCNLYRVVIYFTIGICYPEVINNMIYPVSTLRKLLRFNRHIKQLVNFIVCTKRPLMYFRFCIPIDESSPLNERANERTNFFFYTRQLVQQSACKGFEPILIFIKKRANVREMLRELENM